MSKDHLADVYVFGDLACPFEEDLKQLLHHKSNPSLQAFLRLAAAALRKEFGALPAAQRQWLPPFTSVVDLVSGYETSTAAPAVRSALLTLYQVGRFISYHSEGANRFPTAQGACLIGLCTGSFAAVAVSASSTVAELITTGVEATLVAFRTGLYSLTYGFDVQGSTDASLSWSITVGMQEEEVSSALSSFNATKTSSLASRPYISAVSPSSVTVSGEPAQLAGLAQFAAFKSTALEIFSPYHASHLFTSEEASDIVETHAADLEAFETRIPILSPVFGEILEHCNFRDALISAVNHTLRDQLRLDKISSTLAHGAIGTSDTSSYRLWPVGSSIPPSIRTSLRHHSRQDVSVRCSMTGPPTLDTGSTEPFADSDIAIVGFSGRYPEADSNEEFWELLRAGRDVHRTIPEDRFDWQTHFDETGKKKNTSRIKHGCFIKQPGLMDARFFNISPREAENADPAQRLALMATYEALEMSGYVPNRTPSTQQDRVGCFFGITSDDWREVNSGQDVDTYFIPGGNRAFLPGRISYFFRFSGPSISMDTACSSSFAAIQTACSYLWRGECDTAVAGGANVLTNPDNFAGLDRGHFLSTTGNCNAFDDNADGYCRADGVGSVILKRLEDAQADGDPVFAVIAGSNTNHCGQTDSITRPFEGDQVAVFRNILRHANVDPHTVSYVEMHGTGTQAGDATEMSSVLKVFDAQQDRTAQQPLHLGSAKANIGHAEAASGVSSLVKVLMMMQHEEIPPHCGIKTKINHHYPLDLEERNVHIARKPTKWLREGKRTAFLNNFSAAGGNTAILLQDPPEQQNAIVGSPKDPRESLPVCVSAKSRASLKGIIHGLIEYLDASPDESLSSLSYTINARRSHYNYRACFIASTISSLQSQLHRWMDNEAEAPSSVPRKPRKVAFVFTGQGSLYSALGKELFDSVDSFRADLLRYDAMACSFGFPTFLPIVNGSAKVAEDAGTTSIQLALCCVQMALYRLWKSWGIEPSMVTGHSLGEYAALYAAGVLSASDAIWLVGKRAELISGLCTRSTHSMLAVKASLSAIDAWLDPAVHDVACINSPDSTVISGPNAAIQELKEQCKSQRVESSTLEIPYAFHSAQVDPILEAFVTASADVAFKRPRIPYVSPLNRSTIRETGVLNGIYLSQAARGAVDFLGAVRAAVDDEVVDDNTLWLEIGSHPVCSRMVKDTLGSHTLTACSLRKGASAWTSLAQSLQMLYLQGANIEWSEYHRPFGCCQKVLNLPKYSWDLANYWIPYRNNFCLTKGELPAPSVTNVLESAPYLSSSVHRIVEESAGSEKSTVTVQSNLGDERLQPVVHGHKVNGVSLCPSSLYADMAMTIAQHLARGEHADAKVGGFDVAEMLIEKPLIATGNGEPQYLRVSATADWTDRTVSMRFFSVNAQSQTLADHAICTVKITPSQEWSTGWNRMAHLVNNRIAALEQESATKDISVCHRLKRAMAYKLFSSFVDYDETYQGMDEVIINTAEREATARVVFKVRDRGFGFDPCWVDSLGHIAGFVMNNQIDGADEGMVFVNHGWVSARFAKPIVPGGSYTTYNKMHLVGNQTYVGDTYVLEDGIIVGVIEGVKFQGVPRQVLDNLLPKGGGAGKAAKTATRRAACPPVTPVTTSKRDVGPTKKQQQPQESSAISDLTGRVMSVIADEARIDIKDLGDDTDFADLGIDSLLGLTISGRLQEELGIEVSSSDFSQCPTFGDFARNLIGPGDSSSSSATGTDVDDLITPATPDSSATSQTNISLMDDHIDLMSTLRSAISRETGVPLKELTPSLCLRDVGVDSLLALNVMATLSDQLDQQLPPTLLADHDTLGEIETTLGMNGYITAKNQETPSTTDAKDKSTPQLDQRRDASSVLLQGSTKTATKTLFLFPDGAGSAASYGNLHPVSPELVIYGLNCPWLRTPHEMNCSFEQYVAKYIAEIRRRQPTGPYNFGGWSAGGILAYEAAQQLVAAGQRVQNLVLLDSPNPVGLENPPPRMYDFFEQRDFFGMAGSSPPSWLRPHFDAFLAILDSYRVMPFRGAGVPHVHIIYAKDGVCKDEGEEARPEIRDDDPREMLWLLNDRSDFSGSGWRDLVGKGNLSTEALEGVNHFTLVARGPKIGEVAGFVRRSLFGKTVDA